MRIKGPLAILVCGVLLCAGCDDDDTNPPKKDTSTIIDTGQTQKDGPQTKKVKAAWVYIGTVGDLGWTYEHDRGRKYVEDDLLDGVGTKYVENVPEDPAKVKEELTKLAKDGYQIIFTTSFGYGQGTLDAAKENPDTKFEHCSGSLTNSNMNAYFGRMYEARYLAGMVAGEMATTGKICASAAFPIPEVKRLLNAFILGARSVNPTATVEVDYLCTWFDVAKETTSAETLFGKGCEVILQNSDSTAAFAVAKAKSKLAVGYHSDYPAAYADVALVSSVWNWGEYYLQQVKAVRDGTWKAIPPMTGKDMPSVWGSMKDGFVRLSSYGPKVQADVQKKVDDKKKEIMDGKFKPFCGPFNKQDGTAWKADGECLTDEEIWNISDCVEGWVGECGVPAWMPNPSPCK